MLVAEGFSHRAAGADPAAVGTFSPTPDNERDDDECLDEAEDEPTPERGFGEDVVDEKRPCEDEAEGSPVLGGFGAGSVREEGHAEPFAEAAVGEGTVRTHPWEEDVGQEEKRDDLERGEGGCLEFDVGSFTTADAADSEDDDDGGIEEGEEETGIRGCGFERHLYEAGGCWVETDIEWEPTFALEEWPEIGAIDSGDIDIAFEVIEEGHQDAEAEECEPPFRAAVSGDVDA